MFIYRLYDNEEHDVIVIADKECEDLIKDAVDKWHDNDFEESEKEYVANYLKFEGVEAKFYELNQLCSIYW